MGLHIICFSDVAVFVVFENTPNSYYRRENNLHNSVLAATNRDAIGMLTSWCIIIELSSAAGVTTANYQLVTCSYFQTKACVDYYCV